MRTKIKASIVLNPQETRILVGALTNKGRPQVKAVVGTVAAADEMKEAKVIEEFIRRNAKVQDMLMDAEDDELG